MENLRCRRFTSDEPAEIETRSTSRSSQVVTSLGSKHRRLAIGTPHPLQLLDDLAHRRPLADELDGDRHDVLPLIVRRIDEPTEECLDFLFVAPGAHAPEPRELPVRGLRIIGMRLDRRL